MQVPLQRVLQRHTSSRRESICGMSWSPSTVTRVDCSAYLRAETSMVAHLAALMSRWFLSAAAQTASFTRWTDEASTVPPAAPRTVRLMSSTNFHLSGVSSATSFTMVRNTTGPNLVPCGTPQETRCHSDRMPLTRTRFVLLDKKLQIHGRSSRLTLRLGAPNRRVYIL